MLPPARTQAAASLDDLAEVRGQGRARRALEIAAAGGHNLLLRPARRREDDARAPAAGDPAAARDRGGAGGTGIHSVAGLLPRRAGSSTRRRSGRRTTAPRGGDRRRRAGAAGRGSLAHRGVLFLDELPSSRCSLEALRQPLEDGTVSIARATERVVFPARFQARGDEIDRCPCGARGNPAVECTCSAQRLARYRNELSRALLDRFDLVVAVSRARAVELAGAAGSRPLRCGSAWSPPGRCSRWRRCRASRRPRSSSRARSSGCLFRPRPCPCRARRADDRGARGAESVHAERIAEALAYARRGARGIERARARAVHIGDEVASRPASGRRTLRRAPARLRRARETLSGSRPPSSASSRARRPPPAAPACRPRSAAWTSSAATRPGALSRPAVAHCRRARLLRVRRLRRADVGRELAAAGLVVVSGPARGVSAEARRGALEAGGATGAVLGCGIDRDYPAAHAELARRGRRDRPRRLRVRARRRARAVALPGPEPDHRRTQRHGRRGRGAGAERCARRRRTRARRGARGLRRPGPDHELPSPPDEPLLELGAAPLTSAADVLSCFGLEPEPAAAVAVEGAAATLFALLRDAPAGADGSPDARGSTRARWSARSSSWSWPA